MENRTDHTNTQNNHPIFGGRAYVFRRDRSPYWQAAAFLNGHNYRHSTKEEDLQNAIQVAEDWYLHLRGQAAVGGAYDTSGRGEGRADLCRGCRSVYEGICPFDRRSTRPPLGAGA